jgi:ferritin-like metal-binding protein YciE
MNQEHSLHNLMIDEIRDLYDAEKQLVKALPKLAENATSSELREAIEHHLGETEGHVERLEQAFELLGEKAKGKHCAGIAGIIDEGSDLLGSSYEGVVKDVGIIAGAQRAEHYEIAAYGNVIAWAKTMGHERIASLLHETLDEEKSANEKLTEIGEGGLNREASTGAMADGSLGATERV